MSGTFVLQKEKQDDVCGTFLHITRMNKYEIYAYLIGSNVFTKTTEYLFTNLPAIKVYKAFIVYAI
jgi:hypothetical protein